MICTAILGTFGVLGMIGVARHRRRAWYFAHHGGCGPRGWHHRSRGGRDEWRESFGRWADDDDRRGGEGRARGEEPSSDPSSPFGFDFGRLAERGFLTWLYRRLETTHGQEKAIEAAFRGLGDPALKATDSFARSRADLAEVLGRTEFDPGQLAEGWVQQDKALEALRLQLSTALAEVHRVLEPEQRRRLAEILGGRGPAR